VLGAVVLRPCAFVFRGSVHGVSVAPGPAVRQGRPTLDAGDQRPAAPVGRSNAASGRVLGSYKKPALSAIA